MGDKSKTAAHTTVQSSAALKCYLCQQPVSNKMKWPSNPVKNISGKEEVIRDDTESDTDEGILGSTRQNSHIYGTGCATASNVRAENGYGGSFYSAAATSGHSLDHIYVSEMAYLNYSVLRVVKMTDMLELTYEQVKNIRTTREEERERE